MNMRKNLIACLFLFSATSGIVQAALVNRTFSATVMNGALSGQSGTGNFSYDDALIITGDELLTPADGLTLSFEFDGQTFNENNDSGYDAFPELGFSAGQPASLDYFLVNGINGVAFNYPLLIDLFFFDLAPATGNNDYALSLEATYEIPQQTNNVPVPGAGWLLLSGLAALFATSRRRHIYM